MIKKNGSLPLKIFIKPVGLPCFGMRGYHKSEWGVTIVRYIHEQVLNQIAEVEFELIYKTKIKASERVKLSTSKDAADLLRLTWDENKIDFVEQFKVLLLNRSNRVLGIFEASSGGVTGTVVDPKIIFVAALKANACNIIISHYAK